MSASVVSSIEAMLAAFWWAWPGWSDPVKAERYAQVSIAFHLLVAFLPYAGYREPNGFWHYNKTLFLRFLAAELYSSVLFAGLAIAFLALDKLLGVPIAGAGYARLWIVIGLVFNTWFFVAGAPENLPVLESRDDYPRGLSVFTQYVLLPIVIIYLAILSTYLGKVIITRQWPSGWIGYLVSSVAVVGILSWLLVRPLEDEAAHRWVKSYTRGFYLAIMPAIAMLWLAIWKRVDQYGVTERRYFLIVLSLWLAGIAVYYSVRRSRSIAVIPASLCAVAALTFAGPWGAYSVSRISQTTRLRRLLEKNGVLASGTVHPATREVAYEDRREISQALEYLVGTHGTSGIAAWFPDAMGRTLAQRSGRWGRIPNADVRVIMRRMGMAYVTPGVGTRGSQWVSYYADWGADPVTITGYDYAVHLSRLGSDSVRVADRAYARYDAKARVIRIARDGAVVLEIPLASIIEQARVERTPSGGAPKALLRAEASNQGQAALVILRYLQAEIARDSTRMMGLEGELFLRLR